MRRAYPYRELPRPQLEGVLDMLAGRYPSDEFAELRPADRVGSRRQRAARPPERAPAGGRQRRHDPRSRPLRRLPGRRHGPRRRARRGDGLRGAGRPDVPARRLQLAHRAHHPRPRARLPCAGPAGPDPVLARGGRRPPGGARPRRRRVRARDLDHARGSGPGAAARAAPARRARRREPAALPGRAAGRDRRAADRPHHRRGALPRRDRRLAPVRAQPVRRPGARPLGPGAQREPARRSTASTRRPCGRTTASSCTCPTPTTRRPATPSRSIPTPSRT